MSIAAFAHGLGDVAPQGAPAVAPARAGAPPLRDYQVKAVADLRRSFLSGVCCVPFVLPTGGRKTVIIGNIINSAARRGKRVLALVHWIELIDHVAAALDLAGVTYGVIAPGYPEIDAPVQIASVATLSRKRQLERWRDQFDFIVIDEARHAVAGSWAVVIASQPRAHVLGVTGTPERLDGRGLRERFDAMVQGPTTAALSAPHFLCGFVVYAPERGPDLSGPHPGLRPRNCGYSRRDGRRGDRRGGRGIPASLLRRSGSRVLRRRRSFESRRRMLPRRGRQRRFISTATHLRPSGGRLPPGSPAICRLSRIVG